MGIRHAVDAALADAGQRGDGDGEVIGGHGQRLAVEIAAAHHVSLFGEDEGIIGGAVHLDFDDAADFVNRVADGTVDLRGAAKTVGVLDARVVGAV